MQRFPLVLLAFRCAFQVFQVTVQVPDGTFFNDLGGFQVSGESGVYNTFRSPQPSLAAAPVGSPAERILVRNFSLLDRPSECDPTEA